MPKITANTKALRVRAAREEEVIRCPDTREVVDHRGGLVPDTPWWRSRIRTGRVIDIEAEQRGRASAEAASPDLAAENDELSSAVDELSDELSNAQDQLAATGIELLAVTNELEAAKKRIAELEADAAKAEKSKGKGKG